MSKQQEERRSTTLNTIVVNGVTYVQYPAKKSERDFNFKKHLVGKKLTISYYLSDRQ